MRLVDADRPAGGRSARGRLSMPVLGAVLAAVAVVACGGPSASPSPATSSSASAPGRATPRPTAWPGNAVIGIEALGAADGEIRKGIADFSRGVAEEDLALMRRAADGLAGVDVLVQNLGRIEIFPPMRPMAATLRDVYPRIAGASRDLRAAIDAGDGEAIGAASLELTRALADYAEVQPELAAWVEQSIDQQRLLVQ